MSSARNGPVAGVVLAAGASTRLGRNKLLIEIEGEPLVRRTVGRALNAGLAPVIVVLGHEAALVIAALAGLPCTVVINDEYARGINVSLQTGIRAVPDGSAAAIVMLADMPFVTSSMLATLVARYRESGAPLIASGYGDVYAPPTLYDRALFDELLSIDGQGCARRILKRHRDEAVDLAWPADALADVDVPEDCERVQRLVATHHWDEGHAY
jgi:molybdenum cofactor cytidylyltransferase